MVDAVIVDVCLLRCHPCAPVVVVVVAVVVVVVFIVVPAVFCPHCFVVCARFQKEPCYRKGLTAGS